MGGQWGNLVPLCFINMEQRTFFADKHHKTLLNITFYSHLILIPVMLFLISRPYVTGDAVNTKMGTTILLGLITVYLAWQAFRSLRVLLAIKKARLTITDDVLDGVSLDGINGSCSDFCIRISEVRSVAKTTVELTRTRVYPALVLNTDKRQYTLFALEELDTIKAYIESEMPTVEME